jgi:hypothetical protein
VGCDDNLPYHLDCYKHKYHPECHVCCSFIPERADGKIEYKENPFWREKYCPAHQRDGTPQCCACSRLQQRGDEWVRGAVLLALALLCCCWRWRQRGLPHAPGPRPWAWAVGRARR